MMAGPAPRLSGAQLLGRRLWWNRAVGEQPRQQPVVVLLGPVGSGKTTALTSISRDCGAGIVHARLDVERTKPESTVEALAEIADGFSRNWPNRPAARFTRLALGLIAVQANLDTMHRAQGKEELRRLIDNVFRSRRIDQVKALIAPLADGAAAANVLTAPMAETVKKVLPLLVDAIGRRPLSRAERWHADIPQAEGASPLDALWALNKTARDGTAHDAKAEMTAWLTSAFLADVREEQPRLAKPEPGSPCACERPDRDRDRDRDRVRHVHNWVLLVDDIDQDPAAEFVADLVRARHEHLRDRPDDHDALLVIATSGRWNRAEWDSTWRPPWTSQKDGRRAVRTCRDASYQDWDQGLAPEVVRSWQYPVLLEMVNVAETARELATGSRLLAQHATGGLPAPLVDLILPLLRGHKPEAGARDVLWPADPANSERTWHKRLTDLRVNDYLPHIPLDEFVSATPFATAPWLVPEDSTSLISRPHVPLILTELRTGLWVSAPPQGGGTANYAELNPWVARTLVCALVARHESDELPCYRMQFEALLADPETRRDPVRTAYCQLALGQVGKAVTFFEDTFDAIPHQEWIDRLRLVTRAPDDMPPDKQSHTLYQELVNADGADTLADRSRLRNVITRLVVALWQARNPFAMPDQRLCNVIKDAYNDLRPESRRADVAALTTAADRAARCEL